MAKKLTVFTFKVIAKIDKGNGIEDVTFFCRNEKDEMSAERNVKYYILDNFPQYGYFGVKTIEKI